MKLNFFEKLFFAFYIKSKFSRYDTPLFILCFLYPMVILFIMRSALYLGFISYKFFYGNIVGNKYTFFFNLGTAGVISLGIYIFYPPRVARRKYEWYRANYRKELMRYRWVAIISVFLIYFMMGLLMVYMTPQAW